MPDAALEYSSKMSELRDEPFPGSVLLVIARRNLQEVKSHANKQKAPVWVALGGFLVGSAVADTLWLPPLLWSPL